jgi:RNA polymerase sigma-70 factor (ECF subfamily)
MDEKEAIACLQGGDPAGLAALVDQHQLRAVRAAALITGDRPLAEDIVQSAFLRAAARIGQFHAERPFGPWFLRSVVHDAVKAAQRQKRFVPLEPQDGSLSLDLRDPAPLPEARLEAQETRQAIWQALARLTPDQRAAVVLRYYLEMSEAEMTAVLQRPTSTIKWRLYAARRRLATLLTAFAPPAAAGGPRRDTAPYVGDAEGDIQ